MIHGVSKQPEPESGYALNKNNCLWRELQDKGQWASDVTLCDSWVELCEKEGPMTPLLSAERPKKASEHALPAVVWIEPANDSGNHYISGPQGELGWWTWAELEEAGLPRPSAAAKSLKERLLREADDWSDTDNPIGALLREAAAELER